jgi:hypothetical protein
MTLANMRENCARSIETRCECGRSAIVNVSTLAGEIEVQALRRMKAREQLSERNRPCAPHSDARRHFDELEAGPSDDRHTR